MVRKTKTIYIRNIISVMLIVWAGILSAQIKFDVKVSDHHVRKLEKAKGSKAKLAGYQKFYKKDSIKAAKKAWSSFRKDKKDSLKTKHLWKEAKQNKGKILSNRWEFDRVPAYEQVDPFSFPIPKDSLDWAFQELARHGEFEELQQIYSSYAQYDSAYMLHFHPDSITLDSAMLSNRFDMKQRISSYLPEELRQETDVNIAKQIEAGTIDQYGAVQKIDRSGVKEFFKNVSPEQFSKSQVAMTTLKKKYATLPSLEKEEEGIKRNSLEELPWKKRLYLGGNVTIQSTHPLILDSDIRLGYRLNKYWAAGVGLVLREQFNNGASSDLTGDAHGYSLFSSYEIVSSYFAYGEFQAVQNRSLFEGSGKPTNWQYSHLLGAGKSFRLGRKISASIILLYDFNYKNNDLNARPLVMRFGYSIGF